MHIFFGIGGNSFVPGRIDDCWGIAYFNYKISSDLRNAAQGDLGIGFNNEESIEIFSNLALLPWFRVTVDLQIIDPFPTDKDKAVVTGISVQTKL